MIVLVALGAVEGASVIFLKQALVQSAYEGAKVAVRRGSTTSEVIESTESVLSGRELNDVTVRIHPRDITRVDRGETITVTISAPSDTNSVFPFGPFQGQRIEVSAVMVKE